MAPEHYEIRIEGASGKRWTAWFEGLQVSDSGDARKEAQP